jgi:uncharacterized phiE125 gp8 family phage protein
VFSRGYELSLVTAPVEEPVTVAEAKVHCRVSHDADDALYAVWIGAARRLIEEEAGVRLVNQTWRLSLDDWPAGGEIKIPIGPVVSVSTLKYLDDDATLTTLVADTDYLTALGRRPPVVYCHPDESWPSVAVGRLDAVRLEFVAGYGASAASVPETAKNAILLTVGYWDSNRGDDEDPAKLGLPPGVLRLIRLLDRGSYR